MIFLTLSNSLINRFSILNITLSMISLLFSKFIDSSPTRIFSPLLIKSLFFCRSFSSFSIFSSGNLFTSNKGIKLFNIFRSSSLCLQRFILELFSFSLFSFTLPINLMTSHSLSKQTTLFSIISSLTLSIFTNQRCILIMSSISFQLLLSTFSNLFSIPKGHLDTLPRSQLRVNDISIFIIY